MSTVQYFRPVSSDPQAPLHAFDVVTTDRDWALGAENPTALQVSELMLLLLFSHVYEAVLADSTVWRVCALMM
jgi:hypothetical protein